MTATPLLTIILLLYLLVILLALTIWLALTLRSRQTLPLPSKRGAPPAPLRQPSPEKTVTARKDPAKKSPQPQDKPATSQAAFGSYRSLKAQRDPASFKQPNAQPQAVRRVPQADADKVPQISKSKPQIKPISPDLWAGNTDKDNFNADRSYDKQEFENLLSKKKPRTNKLDSLDAFTNKK